MTRFGVLVRAGEKGGVGSVVGHCRGVEDGSDGETMLTRSVARCQCLQVSRLRYCVMNPRLVLICCCTNQSRLRRISGPLVGEVDLGRFCLVAMDGCFKDLSGSREVPKRS